MATLLRVEDTWQQYLPGHLVQYACNTQHQQGPRVAKHLFALLAIELPFKAHQLADEAERYNSGTQQVDGKGITDVYLPLGVDLRHEPVSHHVKRNAHEDKQQLERCKLNGAMLVAQIGKGDGLEGILSHGYKHHTYVPLVVGIVEHTGDGVDKQQYQCSKREAHAANHHQCRAVHTHLVALFLIHKAEEGGFHTKRKQHHEQRCLGIDIVVDAVIGTTLQCVSIEWHHQVVQESTYNARKAVDGRVFY